MDLTEDGNDEDLYEPTVPAEAAVGIVLARLTVVAGKPSSTA